MALSERFGHGMGTTLGIQLRAITGIATMTVDGVSMLQTEFGPGRNAVISFTVDGESYELRLEFNDETLDGRTFLGKEKKTSNG